MASGVLDRGVADVYARFPFPKRDARGVTRMNQDLIEKMALLGVPLTSLAGVRLLDAGCGTGELSCLMAEHGAQVTSIDVSEPSLDYARKLAASREVSVNFLHGSLLRYPWEPGSFDGIVSHMVLHHTEDPERGFANLARALKPGGWMIVRVFTFWGSFSPFQTTPLWKLWIVRSLARTPDARVRLAEQLFYRPGMEAQYGVDKMTYLSDAFAVPQIRHHAYGELLGWCRRHGIRYERSTPPMEFRQFVDLLLDPSRASQTVRGRWFRRLGQAALTVLPLHRLPGMDRPTWLSRGLSQAVTAFSAANMVTIIGRKPTAP